MIEAAKITSSEDYYPFKQIESTDLNFPDFVDEEPDITDPQVVARAEVEVYGVKGSVFVYPVMPEKVDETPMGGVEYRERNINGERTIIETPVSLGVSWQLESVEDFRALKNGQAKFTMGERVYLLDCIWDVPDDDEEFEYPFDTSSSDLKTLLGESPQTGIPGIPDPLSRVKINFLNAELVRTVENLKRRLGESPTTLNPSQP